MRTILALLMFAVACTHSPINRYESSTPDEKAHFKKVMLPFSPGTHFKISQGAFGRWSHHDAGHEYTWDFDVRYGTLVLAVESGTVIQVWEPNAGGGCDPKYNDSPHNVQVEQADGTVAQYTHVQSLVKVGQKVSRGQPIAATAKNGFICTPQLDFTVFRDRDHTFLKGHPRNIPLLFYGLPDGGMAHEVFDGEAEATPQSP